ncbi:hypothetical protein CASFOL_019945 [Castilleja foliolosa]|uniref:KIB1-4 beta-propeller domain-containing protein n=1 Tax=Castilleja foliolosa TaxID=1961234 RepID=A0ABD3CZF6_9LAMI
MGEKKMIKKERKSPSKKKAEPSAVVPSISRRSWLYHNKFPISCPSFPKNLKIFETTRKYVSGSGGITKSWISSRCTYQTWWPQLAEINISPQVRNFQNVPLKMSTSSSDGIRMVITGISSPAFVFYRIYQNYPDHLWKTRDCNITEYYSGDNRFMEFTNVIRSQGTYYVISRQGTLAVIELVEYKGYSGKYRFTAFGNSRVVPNCQVSKHFREYLLEYEGEVYVVFLLSRVSINVVDSVEVLRLDKSKLSWKKVDRLVGDAMFFLQDDQCMGISARLLGCSKGSNCVYFTHDRADGTWFVYDMKSGCISTTPGPDVDL